MIKKLISKLFGIKQCACPEDEPLVLQELTPVKKPEHCDGHLRFKKNCIACKEAVA
jgi:hypothetical protein